jgi:hypothetical protein
MEPPANLAEASYKFLWSLRQNEPMMFGVSRKI